MMEWRGAVGAKDDGDDSLRPTVDGFRGDGGELAPRLAGGCSALNSFTFNFALFLTPCLFSVRIVALCA